MRIYRLLFRGVADIAPTITMMAMIEHWSLYIGIPLLFASVMLNYIDGAWDTIP